MKLNPLPLLVLGILILFSPIILTQFQIAYVVTEDDEEQQIQKNLWNYLQLETYENQILTIGGIILGGGIALIGTKYKARDGSGFPATMKWFKRVIKGEI